MTNTHSEPTLFKALTLDPVDTNHSDCVAARETRTSCVSMGVALPTPDAVPVVAGAWDLSVDDLSVAFAEQAAAACRDRVAQALKVLESLNGTLLPDRALVPFRAAYLLAKQGEEEARLQMTLRGRTKASFRIKRAKFAACLYAPVLVLPTVREIVPSHVQVHSFVLAGVTVVCSTILGGCWAFETRKKRRIAPLMTLPIFPELPDGIAVPASVAMPSAVVLDPARSNARSGDSVVRHDALLREYVAFECDPVAVFTLPLLADVRVPDTAAFHDALAEADQARELAGSSPGSDPRFREAVQVAENAWRDAKVTAALAGRRSPQELRDCLDPSPARDARIGRALACARVTVDPKLSRAERDAAHVAMLRAADGVTPVPRGVREMLAITAG